MSSLVENSSDCARSFFLFEVEAFQPHICPFTMDEREESADCIGLLFKLAWVSAELPVLFLPEYIMYNPTSMKTTAPTIGGTIRLLK